MEDSDNPYRQRIIKITSQAAAVEILHELDTWNPLEENSVDHEKHDTSQKDRLFQRFITLLSHPTNTEREVRAYAEQLLVTPKYLSAVCKEKSGRTAMDWITESTVAHIKYYLLQTDLTVKEIAFKLDFPDVSFSANTSRSIWGRHRWSIGMGNCFPSHRKSRRTKAMAQIQGIR